MIEPLPCPFCGHVPDLSDPDTLYPSGVFWRRRGDYRTYHGWKDRKEGDSACYGMHCTRCDAEITKDSKEEAIAAWNMRSP